MKAFVMTMDALMCLLILLSLPFLTQPADSLNEQLLYQQAQDIVEVCTTLNRLNESCFSYVEMNYCFNNCSDAMIKRDYINFSLIPD